MHSRAQRSISEAQKWRERTAIARRAFQHTLPITANVADHEHCEDTHTVADHRARLQALRAIDYGSPPGKPSMPPTPAAVVELERLSSKQDGVLLVREEQCSWQDPEETTSGMSSLQPAAPPDRLCPVDAKGATTPCQQCADGAVAKLQDELARAQEESRWAMEQLATERLKV